MNMLDTIYPGASNMGQSSPSYIPDSGPFAQGASSSAFGKPANGINKRMMLAQLLRSTPGASQSAPLSALGGIANGIGTGMMMKGL